MFKLWDWLAVHFEGDSLQQASAGEMKRRPRLPDAGNGSVHGIINSVNYPLVRQALQLEICFKALINLLRIRLRLVGQQRLSLFIKLKRFYISFKNAQLSKRKINSTITKLKT